MAGRDGSLKNRGDIHTKPRAAKAEADRVNAIKKSVATIRGVSAGMSLASPVRSAVEGIADLGIRAAGGPGLNPLAYEAGSEVVRRVKRAGKPKANK